MIAVVDTGIGIPAALRIASEGGKIKFNQLQRLDDADLVWGSLREKGLALEDWASSTFMRSRPSRGGRLVALSLGDPCDRSLWAVQSLPTGR